MICYDLFDSWRYLDVTIYMDNWYRCMLKFTWTLQIHDGYTWVHMDNRNVRINDVLHAWLMYMHVRWYVEMIEVYRHILMNLNNRSILIYVLKVTWFIWLIVVINGYSMNHIIDKYMMSYKVVPMWYESDDT